MVADDEPGDCTGFEMPDSDAEDAGDDGGDGIDKRQDKKDAQTD